MLIWWPLLTISIMLRTNSEYQNLKITYDRQRGYLKHLMVKHEFFSNCDVVLTWPYDKVLLFLSLKRLFETF